MFLVELRKVVGGSELILPLFAEETVTDVFNDAGLIEFSYPLEDAKLSGLADGVEVKAITVGGKVFRGEIQGTGTDYTTDAGVFRRFSVPTGMAYLNFAVVYGSAWPSPIPTGHGFVQNNAGTIIRTLMTRASTRGTLTDIDVSTFTGSLATDGASWAKLITIEVDGGTTYLQSMKDLCDTGMCDIRFDDKVMKVYNPGTSNAFITSFVFRRGQNADGMTEETSSSERASVVLVTGEEGAAIEVTDATTISAYRRRERFVTAGGIADSATLGLVGQAELDGRKNVLTEVNLNPIMDPTTGPFPWLDYKTGDWVYYEVDGSIVQVQVRQITSAVDGDGNTNLTITIGTMLDDLQAKLARKINAITGGNGGNYGAIPASLEYVAPAAPGAVTAVPAGYIGGAGQAYSQVTISWPAVTTNSDLSPINDLAGYEVQWLVTGFDWSGSITTDLLVVYISNLVPGLGFIARVRAFDKDNNYGEWRYSGQDGGHPFGQAITLPGDTVPPPTPSTPVVQKSLVTALVVWDGKGSVGEAQPLDYSLTEVHISTTGPTFTPTGLTLVGSLYGAGSVQVSTPTVGTVYYVRLVSKDRTGNASTTSAAASAVVISAVPSTPTVTGVPAGMRVDWDGQNNAAQLITAAAGVEVHFSSVSGFTPTYGAGGTLDGYIVLGGGEHIIYGAAYDTTYYVRLVTADNVGNKSTPSTQATGTPARLSDPDLPNKLITGAKLADNTINVRSLTVAAFDDNKIINAGFEDYDPASTPSANQPYHWGAAYGSTPTPTFAITTTAPLDGAVSLNLGMTDQNAWVRMANDAPIPCAGGDIFYCKTIAAASRTVAGTTLELHAVFSTTIAKSLALFDAECSFILVDNAQAVAATTILEGSATCPSNMRYVRFLISAQPALDGSGYTARFDACELRKIVGEAAIANASISNAKIQNLAVDDAKIGNVSVGKVTAGTITSTWLMAGNIRTAVSGARVELNTNGFQAYNASNVKTVEIKSSDGSAAFTGAISGSTVMASTISGSIATFPDNSSGSGYVYLSGDGLQVWMDATTNMVTDPSFEVTATTVKSNAGIGILYSGAAMKDLAGNTDVISAYGKSAFRVRWSGGDGYVAVRGINLSASTTYTFSIHVSMTASSDGGTIPFGMGFANLANFGIWEVGGSARNLGNGHTGYIITGGALAGKYPQVLTSGVVQIGFAGWYMRHYLTFTTPANLVAGGAVEMRLPVMRTSGGGNETTGTWFVYDAAQIEASSSVSAYCDGDQYGCNWNGTAHASTSTRPLQATAVLPTYGSNFLGGKIANAETVTADAVKVGSGTLKGTNAIEVFNLNGMTLLDNVWTDIGYTSTYADRTMADDGVIFTGFEQFTSQVPGFFMCGAAVSFPAPTGSLFRAVRWISQGASVFCVDTLSASGITSLNTASPTQAAFLPGGGYWVKTQIYSNNGTTITIPASSGATPYRATFVQVA